MERSLVQNWEKIEQ